MWLLRRQGGATSAARGIATEQAAGDSDVPCSGGRGAAGVDANAREWWRGVHR